jgi:membrane associated rhomboid family serine protease
VVLPVHDLNPVRRTPWVTYGLVAANVIVLLLIPWTRTSVTGAVPPAQARWPTSRTSSGSWQAR